MLMGFAMTVVEQLNGIALYELKVEDSDDADDEIKIEKEKETYTFKCHILPINKVVDLSKCLVFMFITDDKLISELFSYLPELPPELECGF